MKQLKHIGVYGLLLKDNKILLIKKCGGPYDGKLDLPGGTIEFNEDIEEALIREFKEEVGIDILDLQYKLTYPSVIKEAIKYQMIEEMKSEELNDVAENHIIFLYRKTS